MTSYREVLKHGYVRIPEEDGRPLVMGSDLSVVNAARASFSKESKQFSESDAKLLRFLLREGHTSPFRHAFFTLEINAPLMVARQWWKYVVGSDHTMDGWNEASRRYVTSEPEFYVPERFRSAPENRKQGSGDFLTSDQVNSDFRALLETTIQRGVSAYEAAMEAGIAAEEARLFLPAYAMFTSWRWSGSLQSLCHFLNQRLEHDAQSQIRVYAEAVLYLMEPHFPVTIGAIVKERNG